MTKYYIVEVYRDRLGNITQFFKLPEEIRNEAEALEILKEAKNEPGIELMVLKEVA